MAIILSCKKCQAYTLLLFRYRWNKNDFTGPKNIRSHYINENVVIWLTEQFHTISHYCAVAWCGPQNCNVFSFLQSRSFGRTVRNKQMKKIPEKTKRRAFTVSWIKKSRNFWKKLISAPTLQMSNWQFFQSARTWIVKFNTKTGITGIVNWRKSQIVFY